MCWHCRVCGCNCCAGVELHFPRGLSVSFLRPLALHRFCFAAALLAIALIHYDVCTLCHTPPHTHTHTHSPHTHTPSHTQTYVVPQASIFGEITGNPNVLFNNIRVYGTILLFLMVVIVFIGVKIVSHFPSLPPPPSTLTPLSSLPPSLAPSLLPSLLR